MSEAIRLLHALAQALSTTALYSPGHPASARALDGVWIALQELLAATSEPVFLFLGSAPVFDGRTLHELSDWPWSARLSRVGIQRLEFHREVTRESLDGLLEQLQVRLTTGNTEPEESAQKLPGIAYGPVAVMDEVASDAEEPETPDDIDSDSRELVLDLTDELAAAAFIRLEASRGVVARAEAEAVVRILGSHLDRHPLPQASPPRNHEAYPEFHAINTALLAMAGATAAGIEPVGRHRMGVAGLLHDIGMARLPVELVMRDTLTLAERSLVESHPVEGARLLLSHPGRGLELAAVVAFEHHLRPDGSGYPARRFPSSVHSASRLIGVCASYVALRAARPFRPAWSVSRALDHLTEGAGTVFDAEAAHMVVELVKPTVD
jgi:HD-GYP domain-containing protein (c-di-GMP phosphodiesterase class II)